MLKTFPAASDRWLPAALLILLGTLWGSTFSISKIAIDEGVPPFGYAIWQCLGAGGVLAAIALLRGERFDRRPRVLLFGILAGQFGISIPNLIFYHVIGHLPAGLMAVVITTAPLVTYIGALLLKLEKTVWLRVAGLGLGFLGALALVVPPGGLPEEIDVVFLALGFLTPIFYALNSLYSSVKRPSGVASTVLAMYMLLGAALVQLPLVFLLGQTYAPLPPFSPGDLAVLAQIAVSSFAYLAYFDLLRRAGPVFFSQVGYVVTLTGVIWGVIFFGERLDPSVYGAAALILFGLALVNRRQAEAPASPVPPLSPPPRSNG